MLNVMIMLIIKMIETKLVMNDNADEMLRNNRNNDDADDMLRKVLKVPG